MHITHEGVAGVGLGEHVGNLIEGEHGALERISSRDEVLEDLLGMFERLVDPRAHLVLGHLGEPKSNFVMYGTVARRPQPTHSFYVSVMEELVPDSSAEPDRSIWALDPSVRHLNHGSFGAVLHEVLDLQTEWRQRLEADPSRFVYRDLQPAMDRARRLAQFVGAEADGLVLRMHHRDRIGPAPVRAAASPRGPGAHHRSRLQRHSSNPPFHCRADRAEVAGAPVPFPIELPGQVTEAVLAAVTPRTKLVVIDHVTSPSALVFPVEDIVAALEPEIPVVVDGAHGPGQISVALDDLVPPGTPGTCTSGSVLQRGGLPPHRAIGSRSRFQP